MFIVFNKQQYINRADKSKNKYRSLVQNSSLTNFFLSPGFPPRVNTLAATGLERESFRLWQWLSLGRIM